MVKCYVCEKAYGLRIYGIIFCSSCLFFYRRSITNVTVYKCICRFKLDPQQPCKACRIQKCHTLRISSLNIRNISPLAIMGNKTTQIFAELLENLIEVCNKNSTLTRKYLLRGDKALTEIAIRKFAHRNSSIRLTKYKQIWSGMFGKHNITWKEIPVIFDLFLRFYYPDITKLVDPIYAAKNRKEHLKDVKGSRERLAQLNGLSQYLLTAILPAAPPYS